MTTSISQPPAMVPYQFYALLRNIDPALDENWIQSIQRVLIKLNADHKKIIFDYLFKIKNISCDPTTGSFVFKGNQTLFQLRNTCSHPKLNALCDKLYQSFNVFNTTQNIIAIADFIESALALIDGYDVEENVLLQQEKQTIRKAFLYDCAAAIKTASFDLPVNQRNLTIDIIKTYFTSVYLKQQLLGYWFKSMPLRDLHSVSHPLFSEFIAHEAKARQLELVKTSRYLFLIGPVRTLEQNPYSIRRFLTEEKALTGDFVYFNSTILDLDQLNDQQHIEHFKWQTSRIVTIQRQVNQQVFESIESFDQIQQHTLKPLLFRPLNADGLSVDKAIKQRLLDYEKALTVQILDKAHHALDKLAKHNDDFEYLFFGLRAILIELLNDMQIFSQQPAMLLSTDVRNFECRLASYIKLIEKRKTHIFCADAHDDMTHDAYETPISELKKLTEMYTDSISQHTLQLKSTQREMRQTKQQDQGFFSKLFNKAETLDQKINDLTQRIADLRKECFIEIIKVPKIYPQLSVYLEFESLISINEKERHYAFPRGEKGLGLLPLLINLPEDRSRFNLPEMRQMLVFDIFAINQKWQDDLAQSSPAIH